MDFLLEIGTEEIPARMIDSARDELSRRVGDLLQRERLGDKPALHSYSTPRRLAVLASGVAAAQPDISEQVTGPSLKVAYKDGAPTPAEAFARKVNVPVGSLEKITTPKGEYLAATVLKKGRPAAEILAESLPKEIAGIYWAKNMYWRGKSAERFVRPVRWLVTLLDGEVVPLEFAGIRAGDVSQGHRILSSGTLTIKRPADYATTLASGSVIATSAEREERIRKALDAATRTISAARWREDKSLLDTVVNLTEFPSAVLGSFDPEFLVLADEVLVTVMRDHQKYFALEDSNGKLLPHFLAVLNTDGDPDGLIRHGNERVLRARFNDARFFWETDQKIPLRDRVAMLKSVTFQKDLGSYYDKTLRVQHLSAKLCAVINYELEQANKTPPVRHGVVFKAAHLCKADLTTELVREFTELQGIIGGLYAKAQDLDPILPRATVEAIGDAIYDHYKPESMDDSVPRTVEGGVLAIADKADSIAGMFALGLQPTGSKDPFALRRAANGIVKIIAEHKLPLPISKLFSDARSEYAGSDAERHFDPKVNFDESIASFMRERLEFYLRDARGFAYDVVNAVLAADADDVVDAIARAEAVSEVRGSEDFASISVAFKRIKNILRQAQESNKAVAEQLEVTALADDAELALAMEIPGVIDKLRQMREQENAAVEKIQQMREQENAVVEKVQQMREQENAAVEKIQQMRERDDATVEKFQQMREQENAVVEKFQQMRDQENAIAEKVRHMRGQGDYASALIEVSRLRQPVDTFFDKVMVMVDDERVRANRLALLRDLLSEFSTIADFSEIVTEGK